MAEALFKGSEERAELEKKLKVKQEVFDKIEKFVKKSVFYSKMLRFNGKARFFAHIFKIKGTKINTATWFWLFSECDYSAVHDPHNARIDDNGSPLASEK